MRELEMVQVMEQVMELVQEFHLPTLEKALALEPQLDLPGLE